MKQTPPASKATSMSLKNSIIFSFLILVLLAWTPSLQAAVIFFDDFDSDNGGSFDKNYIRFQNWNVRAGYVDLIGIGSEWDWFVGSNYLYVDMDGSGLAAGGLSTRTPISLPGLGEYNLFFDLAGSQRWFTESITYRVVDHNTRAVYATRTITLDPYAPFQRYYIPFTVTGSTQIDIIFFEPPGSPNHIGLLIDNVGVMNTPLPPGILLFGTGLLGLGVLGWRRQKRR